MKETPNSRFVVEEMKYFSMRFASGRTLHKANTALLRAMMAACGACRGSRAREEVMSEMCKR